MIAVFATNRGDGPTLMLDPAATTALPSAPSPGQFIVLSNGSLWYCGVANKWVQLNKGFTNLLTKPIRVFDSRLSDNPADKSRPAGPAAAQSVTTLQITGTSVSGEAVPAGVVAVVGNATVVNPSAGGWLTLYPAGESTPLASTLNFQSGDVARANFCIVGLSAAGAIDVFAEVATDFLFDITGYVF